jgi:2,3,4,5-tetrahydropyridine-2-carboxylate N-succinyltransferase
MNQTCFALGLGIGTQNADGNWLEVFYPRPVMAPDTATAQAVQQALSLQDEHTVALTADQLDALAVALQNAGNTEQADIAKALQNSTRPTVAVLLGTDMPPQGVPDAYLKLQLISHRLARPHSIDLSGVFGVLPNVAWTSEGAIDLAELPTRQLQARLHGNTLGIDLIDKFPRMTDYVVPSGVRIAHSARVRLGAYLGEGTTIMHEGFVNFNAGTEGPGMIEGRISAGVFVGRGSDLGGGSSTMGTLSGGGNIIISIGEECLIGANAGTGIPLGDRCIIESGLYITAGTKVNVIDEHNNVVEQVKARQLASQSDLLFRRNSGNGAVECLTHKSAIELNEALHANN